jgi:hypothetical protein
LMDEFYFAAPCPRAGRDLFSLDWLAHKLPFATWRR